MVRSIDPLTRAHGSGAPVRRTRRSNRLATPDITMDCSLAHTDLKDIERILVGQNQRFERLAGKLDAQNSLLRIIAERLASIDEHIQGNASLLWRIEAALVVQRQRLDALEKSIASASLPKPPGGP